MKQIVLIMCIGFLIVGGIVSCSSKGKEEEQEKQVQQLMPDAITEVTVMTLQTVPFEHELVSNGKVAAQRKAELRFQSSLPIAEVLVRNGDRVTQGQRLAVLDTFLLANQLSQATDELARSRLELHDVLIGQGYRPDDAAIPEQVMALAKVKSGYNRAVTQQTTATFNLRQATLRAPIAGTVANLFAKQYQQASPSDPFCQIIDNHRMEVLFSVLENELSYIHSGDKVKVTPFAISDLTIEGRIAEVNPWVDANGMIRVKASVNDHPRLVEGMNVRVSIFRSIDKQWVIPKSAVVLRTGKQVVFTLVDGKAMWNYVETGLENATEYTVKGETLKEGDQIIVSGNINLAHESPVKIVSS